MGNVVLVQLDPDTSALLRKSDDCAVEQSIEDVHDDTELVARLEDDPTSVEAIVLGPRLDEPLRLAQRVKTVDKDLSVLILSEPNRQSRLTQAMQFAPNLGRGVSCHSTAEGTALAECLEQSVQRTRLRRSHRSTVAAVQSHFERIEPSREHTTNFLDRLLDYAPMAVAALDDQGLITAWNRAAAQMFGSSEREVLGTRLVDRFDDANRERFQQLLSHVANVSSEPARAAFELLHTTGDVDFVEATAGPLMSQGAVGTIVIFQDMTARRQAENALRHAHDMLEQHVAERTQELLAANAALEQSNLELKHFTYVASHDLQEPLRMVCSFCQLLKQRYDGQLDAQAHQYIDFAIKGAKRLQTLIQDLLVYSRIDNKAAPFAPVDCHRLVDLVTVNLQSSIEDAGAIVTQGALPTVSGDGSQLSQVFQNLIENAIKYRGEKQPRVHLSCQRRDEHWEFCVRDNGIGISPDFADRVFVIFKRLHNQEKYPGTGLGLAICKKVVKRHRGTIWVESELQRGSRFYFTIPASEGSDQ